MDRTNADRASLGAGLEFGRDRRQELRPLALVDRTGQAHQNGHLVVVQLQRHVRMASGCGGATDDDMRAAAARANEDKARVEVSNLENFKL